jgi:ABC-type branched-subunit amino acid transport system substrate-binding protein
LQPANFERQPYRLGVLVDLPGYPGLSDVFVDGVRLALEWSFDEGLIDRPVELVIRYVVGQPWNDSSAVNDAWLHLVENDRVLGVAGPMTTDNSLGVLPEVERLGVPTMTLCGSQSYVGQSAFNLPNGGMADEPVLMTAWLADKGHSPVAVLYDSPSQIGEEYLHYFRLNAAERRVAIATQLPIWPTPSQDDVDRVVAQARASGAQAVVYLTLGAREVTKSLPSAFSKIAWDPPRIATTAFVGASYSPAQLADWEGWTGVDQTHEDNPVFMEVLQLWQKRFGYRPFSSSASCGWDMGRAFGLALGRMAIINASGLRSALETIRRLPAATGGPGTVISFGRGDHRGYKGADYLLLRRVIDGQYQLAGTVPVSF